MNNKEGLAKADSLRKLPRGDLLRQKNWKEIKKKLGNPEVEPRDFSSAMLRKYIAEVKKEEKEKENVKS